MNPQESIVKSLVALEYKKGIKMKRPNCDEICRWLNDDTLVAEANIGDCTGNRWMTVSNPDSWKTIRVSIATVEGKNLFDGDIYYRHGDSFIARATYTYDYSWWKGCTLTPPKPKSILDSDEFDVLLYRSVLNVSAGGRIKQFLRDNKEKI
jgi:hypothetical protein